MCRKSVSGSLKLELERLSEWPELSRLLQGGKAVHFYNYAVTDLVSVYISLHRGVQRERRGGVILTD